MNTNFAAGWAMRLTVVVLAVGSVLILPFADYRDKPYLAGVLLILAVATYIAWPRAIRVDASGIHQRNRLGRSVFISWQEVVEIRVSTYATSVVAQGGGEISHTALHRGKNEFHTIVKQRSTAKSFTQLESDNIPVL